MATTEVLNKEEHNAPLRPSYSPEPEPKKGHAWVWILVILLIAGGVWFVRMHNKPAADTGAPTGGRRGQGGFGGPLSVGVISVATRDVPYYLTGLGSVTPLYTVTVHSRVDGQLMKVYFQEGQFVHEGDPLVDIDPRPFQVALDQAQGQLAKDEAAEADAKIDLTRYQTLYNEGVIPKQQLDTQQATVGQADGAIQADKAQIDNEKLQLAYSHITSPISGRVGLRLVDPGNIVHAADSNGMIVITQVQPITVVFQLPEDNLPEVVAEMKKGTLKVEAYSRDNNTKLADGQLQTIDNEIDPATGTVKLKAQFANENQSLWPNQFVNVRLFLSVKKKALVIPTATIQNGSQGPFVYTVNQDQTAAVRQITEDFSEGNITVVKQGLEQGEQVVVDGQDKLQEGAKVSPHPSTINFTGEGAGQGSFAPGANGNSLSAPPQGGNAPATGTFGPGQASHGGPGSGSSEHRRRPGGDQAGAPPQGSHQ